MPRTSDYNLLLNRGRKAGLTTRELYSALATQPDWHLVYSDNVAVIYVRG